MPESTLVLNTLIPIYIVFLGVLVVFTGAQWRQRPDTESALSVGIFAGSVACLVIQGLAGQTNGLAIALTTTTVVLPAMAIIGLVGERTGWTVPYAAWLVSTLVGAAGTVVLWSTGLPFQVYAWPETIGIAAPGFYSLLQIRRRWAEPVLPVRWLWWIGFLTLTHQLSFPMLRLHDNPNVILYAFGVSLLLVVLAGLCAPAITAEQAGRATVEIEHERSQLLVRNQAIADYLARLAHEFRNPLNAIRGYGELIQESIADGVDATELISDLDRIQRSSKHLSALVDDVLDLSKVEAGRMELRLQSARPDELLADVAATIAPMAEANGNVLHVDSPVAAPARVDPTRVRQCLLNLASNAAKFTHDGEISLRFEPGELWTFRVADQGIGIDAQTQARLFQPFSQGSSDIQHRYGGTGIGLALTRELARAMGGDVTIDSSPGVGSVFTLTIRPGHQAAQPSS